MTNLKYFNKSNKQKTNKIYSACEHCSLLKNGFSKPSYHVLAIFILKASQNSEDVYIFEYICSMWAVWYEYDKWFYNLNTVDQCEHYIVERSSIDST